MTVFPLLSAFTVTHLNTAHLLAGIFSIARSDLTVLWGQDRLRCQKSLRSKREGAVEPVKEFQVNIVSMHELKFEEVTDFLTGLLLDTEAHEVRLSRLLLPIQKNSFGKRVNHFPEVLNTPLGLLIVRFNFA